MQKQSQSIPPSDAVRLSVEPGLVRDARELAGLTREQLAVASGMCSTTLYWAERGIASRRTLKAIEAALQSRRPPNGQ